MRRATRHVVIALLAGVLHATLIQGLALRYGYDVGPLAYDPARTLWLYGGLIALGGLPVWLVLEERLLVPLVILALVGGFAVVAEVTPPEPTFQDVSEIEPNVEEPTGMTVVDNGLHLVKYTSTWYVWAVAIVLAALWEHVFRARSRRLPPPRQSRRLPSDRRSATLVGLGAGLLHALASLGFWRRWGLLDTLLSPWFPLVGSVLVIGVPTYLLVRHDVRTPAAVAIAFFLNSVHSQHYAGPSDPHGLYVGLWFVFLGLALAVGGLEVGLGKLLAGLGGPGLDE